MHRFKFRACLYEIAVISRRDFDFVILVGVFRHGRSPFSLIIQSPADSKSIAHDVTATASSYIIAPPDTCFTPKLSLSSGPLLLTLWAKEPFSRVAQIRFTGTGDCPGPGVGTALILFRCTGSRFLHSRLELLSFEKQTVDDDTRINILVSLGFIPPFCAVFFLLVGAGQKSGV